MSEEYEPRGLQILAKAIDASQEWNGEYNPNDTRRILHSNLERIQDCMSPREIFSVLVDGAKHVVLKTSANGKALGIDIHKLVEQILTQQEQQKRLPPLTQFQPSPDDESNSLSTTASEEVAPYTVHKFAHSFDSIRR